MVRLRYDRKAPGHHKIAAGAFPARLLPLLPLRCQQLVLGNARSHLGKAGAPTLAIRT